MAHGDYERMATTSAHGDYERLTPQATDADLRVRVPAKMCGHHSAQRIDLAIQREGVWGDATTGLSAQVLASGQPVVCRDYPSSEWAVPEVSGAGILTVIGVPVLMSGRPSGVLLASTTTRLDVRPEDVEVLRVLSQAAGLALVNASNYLREHERADTA